MNFLQKLLSGAKPPQRFFVFQVKCKRCGEIIEGRVDTANDLSVEYAPGGDTFHVRKVLVGDGSNYCYQQMEVSLKFDKDRRLVEKVVEGGEFVEV
jgi:hypothetical protein